MILAQVERVDYEGSRVLGVIGLNLVGVIISFLEQCHGDSKYTNNTGCNPKGM